MSANNEKFHTGCHDYPLSNEDYKNTPLVSLEIAVEPLITLLPPIKTYVYLVKQKCQNPADDLTCDQSASIMLCTIQWQPVHQCLSYVLNKTLYSNDYQQLKPWFLYLKLLLTSLDHIPSVPRVVYRGIQSNITKQYPKDEKIIWCNFTLCAIKRDQLYSKKYLNKKKLRTILSIECNLSKDISKHLYDPSMKMVLLCPGTQFQVTECLEQKNNSYSIHLKETESSFQHLQYQVPSDLFESKITTCSNINQSWNGGSSITNEQYTRRIRFIGQSEETNSANFPSKLVNQLPITTLQNSSVNSDNIRINLTESISLEQIISAYPVHSPIQLRLKQISNADMKIIVEQAINIQKCTELWLCNCHITSQGALILSNGLFNNTTLIKLYLNDNNIQDRGVHSLCRVLSMNNSTLKEVYLARNNITSKGLEYLSDMLITNHTLKTLCLYGNKIQDDGIHYLTNTLIHHNRTLEYLYLSGNNLLTDLSIDYLINMFKQNQTLKKVHLFNCNFSKIGKEKLREIVQTKNNFLLYM